MNVIKPFGKGNQTELQITLCDTNADIVQAWLEQFTSIDAVEIVHGSLVETDCHALVSPANSFGDMGGGVDKRIDDFFQGESQKAVTAAIREKFYGELPVGMALVLEMPNRQFSFLISAPTMRIPGDIRGTINAYLAIRGLSRYAWLISLCVAYLAMRATLVAILQHNQTSTRKIQRVAIPGLGTGVGGLPPSEASQQIRAAYYNVVGGRWQKVVSPIMAPCACRETMHKS